MADDRSYHETVTLTIPGDGFPQLLQTGESYHGVHLHDRQHPHDFVMEASFTIRHPLSDWLGAELYLAPVGEPALGPTAFMHRASAEGDPFPPISHHWQDSTHISFGVATAALYTKQVKLEASWFNGREPDDNRWNFDFDTLDSFSVRLSANPVRPVSLQVSYGYLDNPGHAWRLSRGGVLRSTEGIGYRLCCTCLDRLTVFCTFSNWMRDARLLC